MFSFVQIYRFAVNLLTISQNFISISFFIEKLLKKPLGVHSAPPWVEMYTTITDIIIGKVIDLAYLIRGKEVAIVGMFSDNIQYEFTNLEW